MNEQYKKLIERLGPLRERIIAILGRDSEALRAAVLQQLDRIIRDNPDVKPGELAEIIERDLRVPGGARKALEQHLREGQAKLAALRQSMYATITDRVLALDPTALMARTAIDFPAINRSVNGTVQRALRQILDGGGEIGDVTRALRHTRIAAHQARTLSNTALAQYDNATTFQLAKQAGITKYKYHGPPAQREFCQALLATGRYYTLEEIGRMDNGQGLPVWSSCGGYNCRHQWLAVPVRDAASEHWHNNDVAVANQADAEIQESFFGHVLSNEEIIGLTGAPDGGSVHVRREGASIYCRIHHPLYHSESHRRIYRSHDRSLVMVNELLELDEDAPGGFGLRVLAKQVAQARILGIDRIDTLAAKNSSMNGYYTWPRYGFDGPLEEGHLFDLPEEFQWAEYVSDLMDTEEGRQYWREYGDSIRVSFDLAPDSNSMQVLQKYLEVRRVMPWPL
jgi:hypothetical protein